MRKTIAWYVKQFLPLRYHTKYNTPDGERHFATWRMWFGRAFSIKHF